MFGTYAAGVLGQKMPKKNILAFIYMARAVAISIFLVAPLTPPSVYVFSAVMGVLWLSTVPPTNAAIAQIFGVAHLSMFGRFCVLQPSNWLVHGRLAGGCPIRQDRKL